MSTEYYGGLSILIFREFISLGIIIYSIMTVDIYFQELGTVFRRLGERPSDKELKAMVDEVDEDKNGTIEFEEFLNMMAMRVSNSDKILKVFKVFDKNDDGYTFLKFTFHFENIIPFQIYYVFGII